MNDAAETLDAGPVLNTDTLLGDLRDAMLARLKAMPKPWTTMSENEQREMIGGVERAAAHLISQAVELIAANGQPVIRATVDSCHIKDGLKVTLKASLHDAQRHKMTDAVGKSVLIVVADTQPFEGETAPAKPDPQAPPLPLGDGDNVAGFKPRG